MPLRAHDIPIWIYKGLIVIATMIWGLSFVVMKDAVAVMEPSWLIGVRFTLTAIVLSIVFFPRIRKHFTKEYVIKGSILGLLNFLAFWTQTIGLAFTTPGKNAFLTGTYCVIVPFIYWLVFKRKPSLFNLLAAIMCVAGIGFVSLSGDTFTVEFGDGMTLVCAVFFAIHIVFVSRYSEGRDILVLTVLQFWVGGIAGIVVGAISEPFPQLANITPDFIFNMIYLVIFASCIGLVIQNVALAHVPPSQAALFLSLESVFGVIFSVLLFGEQLTVKLVIGFVLIFGAIVISESFPRMPQTKNGKVLADASKDKHSELSSSFAAIAANEQRALAEGKVPSITIDEREIPLAGDHTEGVLIGLPVKEEKE